MSTPTERKIAERIFKDAEFPRSPEAMISLLERAAQEGYYSGLRRALRAFRMDDLAFDRIRSRLIRVIDRMPRKTPAYTMGDLAESTRIVEDAEQHLDWAITPPSPKPVVTQESQLANLIELGASNGRFDKVEVLHHNCAACHKEVQSAVTMASATGSTGTTHGTAEPSTFPYVYAHVARVTDTEATRKREKDLADLQALREKLRGGPQHEPQSDEYGMGTN